MDTPLSESYPAKIQHATHKLAVWIFILGVALWAQTPYTKWDIYRDSTGLGANPVSGGMFCFSDTLWLIADTTGMRAAGITRWRWGIQGHVGANPGIMVYCPYPECPRSAFGQLIGLPTEGGPKVGFYRASGNMTFTLTTYYANGDSLTTYKTISEKLGNVTLQIPASGCANTIV